MTAQNVSHGLIRELASQISEGSHYAIIACISTYDFRGELAGNNYQDPNNRNAERGLCNFDRRQIFNTSMVALSPGAGSGLARQLTTGWQVAPIIAAYTGQPLTPTDGTDVSLTGVGSDRPNVVTTTGFYPHTQASWFNQAAFVVQPVGTYDNAGRDTIIAPGAFNFDLAVSRQFRFGERYRLDVRADAFNVLNHPNWNSPSTTINSSTFGKITAFGSPRIIQLAMKVFF